MGIYFESLQQFQTKGGLKASTITANQLLPAVVAHMQRMDRQFTLQVNGRLPKSMDALLEEVFALCHLQQPFYTQHCASRSSRYRNVSKNRVKIEFTMKYRMTREEEKWVVTEIRRVLGQIVQDAMSAVEKIVAVHDYIVRTYDYEMETKGSPFTVYTFMHEKQGVCMAYALLFEKMMDELGIACYYVVGQADGEGDLGHAWNMVQLEGEWFHVDATWNDLGKRTKAHAIRYRYFLRSDVFMKRDHSWNLAHYPPCVSERFAGLADVYDAVLYDGRLYFPHPKTAKLVSCELIGKSAFVKKKLLDARVQFCTKVGDILYFSHFDKGGSLYSFHFQSAAHACVEAQQVERIQDAEQQLVVHFKSGDVQIIEQEADQVCATSKNKGVATVVDFMQFDQCSLGSYEGILQPVCFKGANGIELFIQQEVRQLTVDLVVQPNEWVDLKMTTARKPLKMEQSIQLTLPLAVIGQVDEIRVEHGESLSYEVRDDSVLLTLERGGRLLLKA